MAETLDEEVAPAPTDPDEVADTLRWPWAHVASATTRLSPSTGTVVDVEPPAASEPVGVAVA